MLDTFLVDFLPILYQKVKKTLLIIQKASISIYKCHAIKYSCPKKLVLKSFLDTILQPRSVCHVEQIMPTTILLAPPDFHTLCHPCKKYTFWACQEKLAFKHDSPGDFSKDLCPSLISKLYSQHWLRSRYQINVLLTRIVNNHLRLWKVRLPCHTRLLLQM